MNIGDRVRLMQGHEEGIITQFLKNDMLEIEIEDGFRIPVMKGDIVLIAHEEATYFHPHKEKYDHPNSATATQAAPPKNAPKTTKTDEIYLAFIPINDRQLALHLVNDTAFTVLYAIAEDRQQEAKGISAGTLSSQKTAKIDEFLLAELEQWPPLIVQLLYHQTGNFTFRRPLVKSMKFKAKNFFKNQQKAPILEQKGHVFPLNISQKAEEKPENLDADAIRNRIYENSNQENMQSAITWEQPPSQIDLHIEKLVPSYDQMSNGEIVALQMETFERYLDLAIGSGKDEITFIHGVGAGTLRKTIHKKLSAMTNIQYYEDAMREKFGYGATLVRIK